MRDIIVESDGSRLYVGSDCPHRTSHRESSIAGCASVATLSPVSTVTALAPIPGFPLDNHLIRAVYDRRRIAAGTTIPGIGTVGAVRAGATHSSQTSPDVLVLEGCRPVDMSCRAAVDPSAFAISAGSTIAAAPSVRSIRSVGAIAT
jgi:hypothetical protein